MTRTSATAIVLTVLIAGVLAWLLEGMLVMSGRAAIVPPLTLGPALALLGGLALGALAFFATRTVVAADAVLALAIVAVGALVQLAAGLIAEHWCVLPPDDEDEAAARAGSPA